MNDELTVLFLSFFFVNTHLRRWNNKISMNFNLHSLVFRFYFCATWKFILTSCSWTHFRIACISSHIIVMLSFSCDGCVDSLFSLHLTLLFVLVLAKMPLAHPLDASAYRFNLMKMDFIHFHLDFHHHSPPPPDNAIARFKAPHFYQMLLFRKCAGF